MLPTFVLCPDGSIIFFGGSVCPPTLSVFGPQPPLVLLDTAKLMKNMSAALQTSWQTQSILSDKLSAEANTNCGKILQSALKDKGINDWLGNDCKK